MNEADQKIFHMIEHHPLSWWVDRIKRMPEEPWSLARFGDGEFLCVEGKRGWNANGCLYTPELRNDLIDTLEDTRITHGMLRILPEQLKRVESLLRGTWVDAEVVYENLEIGALRPLFDALRGLHTVIISSNEKKDAPLPYTGFITAPRKNAHGDKKRILNEVRAYAAGHPEPVTYLFACGMAAGTFVHELHGTIPGASFLDIGHILDPFVGQFDRDYLLKIPKETLMRNI